MMLKTVLLAVLTAVVCMAIIVAVNYIVWEQLYSDKNAEQNDV